jgi:DNA/RNA endonuclease YhcR with UshA esterase domain
MRIFFLILAMFVVKLGLAAQETNVVTPATGGFAPLKISAAAATNYYDKEMIVTGKVAQVTIRPTVTFLNLDKSYPHSPFTVAIIHGHSEFFGNANALKGKSIEIRGKIKNYKNKPEVMLDSTNQLAVLGVTNLSLFLNPPVVPQTTNKPSTNGFPEIM